MLKQKEHNTFENLSETANWTTNIIQMNTFIWLRKSL